MEKGLIQSMHPAETPMAMLEKITKVLPQLKKFVIINVTKRRLRTFENKIWRKICGPVRDAGTNDWRRKFNKELQEELGLAPVTSYIKGQRLQWFGHIMRRSEEETIRAVIEWQPEGKRPRGRPRKRWLDIIEEDLKTVGVEEWKEIIQDREKWRDTVLDGAHKASCQDDVSFVQRCEMRSNYANLLENETNFWEIVNISTLLYFNHPIRMTLIKRG
ncbi:hypothetical protein QTP88_017365 [Uroleucon formosanum]